MNISHGKNTSYIVLDGSTGFSIPHEDILFNFTPLSIDILRRNVQSVATIHSKYH